MKKWWKVVDIHYVSTKKKKKKEKEKIYKVTLWKEKKWKVEKKMQTKEVHELSSSQD